MKQYRPIIFLVMIAIFMNMIIGFSCLALGEGSSLDIEKKIQKHYVNTMTMRSDNAYKTREPIRNDDKHFGIELGQFVISGYTRIEDDSQGNVLVIKGEDDDVRLSFDLRCDIDNLKENEKLIIHDDGDGSDEELGYPKPENGFGRGMLLCQFTNSNGYKFPIKGYKDYFETLASDNPDKDIVMNEEGDWRIALDYETAYPVLAWNGCDQYTIRINVKVRNANCIVDLREVETDRELKSHETTTKGFYLDMANSRCLKVDVSRTNIGEDDVKNNSVYMDGAIFTEKGTYTITVTNEYTGATTVKKLTVDTD